MTAQKNKVDNGFHYPTDCPCGRRHHTAAGGHADAVSTLEEGMALAVREADGRA